MNESAIQIRFARKFTRDLKHLDKKFAHLRQDIDTFIARLTQGETPGDQIPGVGYTAYKFRLKSSDLQKGKRGGFRIIYYIQTPKLLVLLTVYAKSEQTDITPEQIRRIIEDYTPPTS